MKTSLYSIFILCILVLVPVGILAKDREESDIRPSLSDSINSALDYQLSIYPAAQYRDIYKNFMQDFFGPGHILTDTAAAGLYLRQELSESGPFEGPLYEPTGYKGNFYRVNLSLIRDSIIPYQLFFNTFLESVSTIIPPESSVWMENWNAIDSIITARDLHFENEIEDREQMARQFAEGNFIVHHSQKYNETVNFHYRIISRKNFETILLPLIRSAR